MVRSDGTLSSRLEGLLSGIRLSRFCTMHFQGIYEHVQRISFTLNNKDAGTLQRRLALADRSCSRNLDQTKAT